jgi:hypothetical protein
LLGLVYVLAACSNDLDALVCKPGQCPSDLADSGGELETTEPPWLPALPDRDRRDACEACAKEKCRDARDYCLEDDACTAQLGCTRDCSDPGCLRECQSEHAGAGWWSPWWEDLFVCVFRSCPAECNTGRNWGCSHEFDWPRTEESRIPVRARVGGSSGPAQIALGGTPPFTLAGARVRVCPMGGCEGGVFDQGVLDAANSAQLDLPVEGLAGDFRGYLEIESTEVGRLETRYRMHLAPIGLPGEVRMPFADSAVAGDWRSSDGFAAVWAFVVDCTAILGRGLRFELVGQPEAEVEYLGVAFGLDPLAQEAPIGVALLPEVAEGLITLRAVLAEMGDEVARRSVPIRNGWMTEVTLSPPAASPE